MAVRNYITSLNTKISGMICRMRSGNSATRPTVRLPNECTLDMRERTGVCSLVTYQCDDITDRIPQLFFHSTDKLPTVIALAVFSYLLSVMDMNRGRHGNSHGSDVSRVSGCWVVGRQSCSRHRR